MNHSAYLSEQVCACEGQRQAIDEHKEKREPVQEVLRRTVQACGSEVRVDNAMRHMMHSHVHANRLIFSGWDG